MMLGYAINYTLNEKSIQDLDTFWVLLLRNKIKNALGDSMGQTFCSKGTN